MEKTDALFYSAVFKDFADELVQSDSVTTSAQANSALKKVLAVTLARAGFAQKYNFGTKIDDFIALKYGLENKTLDKTAFKNVLYAVAWAFQNGVK